CASATLITVSLEACAGPSLPNFPHRFLLGTEPRMPARLSVPMVAAALAFSLTACGSSEHGVVAPPPPGIAQVVLVTDSGTVFSNAAVPGQRLVVRVIDSLRNVVPSTEY